MAPKKVRKDVFFRTVARNPERFRVRRKWSFDAQVDGIAPDGRWVPVAEFLRTVGPGSEDYKVARVWLTYRGWEVFDRYGGQLYSYLVEGVR